ncbi:MAG: RibD family protein, partial [Xanthomonas sp.]
AATEALPPLRVVLDAQLRSLAQAKVRDGSAPTLYLHAPDCVPPALAHAAFAAVPLHDGRCDLHAALRLLGERGINEVQVEAGATLGGALLRAGLVDEVLVYMAPLLLGDSARPLLAGLGIETMAQRVPLRLQDVRQLGDDLRLLLRPAGAEAASP